MNSILDLECGHGASAGTKARQSINFRFIVGFGRFHDLRHFRTNRVFSTIYGLFRDTIRTVENQLQMHQNKILIFKIQTLNRVPIAAGVWYPKLAKATTQGPGIDSGAQPDWIRLVHRCPEVTGYRNLGSDRLQKSTVILVSGERVRLDEL